MPTLTRLFADKFDYLKAFTDIIADTAKRIGAGCTDVYAIVDDDFLDKLSFDINNPNLHFVGPAAITPEFLSKIDRDGTWFIYAVENSSTGLQAARALIKAGLKYSIAGGNNVGGYAYDNLLARMTVEEEYVRQSVDGYQKFTFDPGSPEDFVNLTQCLEIARNVPGDVVEIGTYRGSSGCVMLQYASNAKIEKNFIFIDTFNGFSYEAAKNSADSIWYGTHRTEGIDAIAARLKSRYDPKRVRVEKMNVIDAFPEGIDRIALVNVDVDIYEAVIASLNRVAPLVSVGGVIVCEDAGHTPALIGARVALDEFLTSPWGGKFTPIFMTSGQTILVRHS